jgi:hypothetical protein
MMGMLSNGLDPTGHWGALWRRMIPSLKKTNLPVKTAYLVFLAMGRKN